MVDINNLTTPPGLIRNGAARQVTFSWDGDVDNLAENPVKIKLSIEAGARADVSFLDINDNLVPEVFWQTSAFRTNSKKFTETLFLKCRQAQATEQSALITMEATNSNGNSTTSTCTITYK
jgi:hypothetical protein